MSDLDLFFELPLTAQLAIICFSVCATVLFMMLMCAPRRNCFYLKWPTETRLLALVFAPALFFIWPIVLYGLFLRSRGITDDDLDFFDD